MDDEEEVSPRVKFQSGVDLVEVELDAEVDVLMDEKDARAD